MKNIFIPEISNINVKNIKKYLNSEIDEKIFLGFFGIYKYINDNLFNFKLKSFREKDRIEKLNNVNIYCSRFSLVKCEETQQIPYEHVFKISKKQIYKLSSKSKNLFIVEFIDNKIDNYYFESFEEFENKSLQEDMSSFLSLLL
tara:strand:+ start:721 stop:1152 length:432 start_codon:yes stop_codon:yes gene_type:complete